MTEPEVKWPNQDEVVDGVVPTEDVPQTAELPDGDDDPELEREMED